MRITGYRTLTTVQDWGRPVGDANGVFPDGRLAVPLILVDTDEGITGVGLGPHQGLESVFAAIEGEDPRGTVALYDRMLHHVFKAGHAGAVFGTIGALDSALWDIKAKAAGQPLWRLLGGLDRAVPAYASGLDIALSEEELASVYRTYADHGLRVAKLKGGLDIEQDLARLTIVRDVLADAHPGARPGLMLDANESWSRKQAVRHVAELERSLDLIWVEEPVRRWDAAGMVAVGRAVRASIAAGREPHRARAVPAAARGRRPRRRPDRRRLGGHPLPAGRRPRARPRPAGQPDRHHAAGPGPRRDRRSQPHGHRAAGPHAARRACRSTCTSRTATSSSGTAPGWAWSSTRRRSR